MFLIQGPILKVSVFFRIVAVGVVILKSMQREIFLICQRKMLSQQFLMIKKVKYKQPENDFLLVKERNELNLQLYLMEQSVIALVLLSVNVE